MLLRQDGAGLTDGQLLEAYLAHRDEAAFAALLRRHAPMVWGVCHRVLGNLHNAEDAFQATFLVLVRKAASVRPRDLVGNWLYGVACRTALKAKAMTATRHAKERQAAQRARPEAHQAQLWSDLQPILDQELSRTPDKYRAAIVLCDLEGKTKKEAARHLGVPEGTLSTWLARGRRLLAKRLSARGVTLGAGAVAAFLAESAAAAAAPAALVLSTLQAATQVSAGGAAASVVSTKVAALTEGVLKAMLLSKLKIATILLLAMAVLGLGAGALAYHAVAGNQQPPAAKPAAPAAQKPKTDKELLQGTWRVVSATTAGERNVELNNAKATFADDKLLVKMKDDAREGVIRLDPATSPKSLDITVIENGETRTLLAIYRLKGNDLTLCMNEPSEDRPTEFVSRAGTRTTLLKLKREPAARAAQKPKTDQELIRGSWKVVAAKDGGREVPEAQTKDIKVVFTEKRFTALTGEGKEEFAVTYELDPSQKPKWIDVVWLKGNRACKGLYDLKGDDLKIVIDEDGGRGRPTDFVSEQGTANDLLFILKREPTAKQRDKQKGDKEKQASTTQPGGHKWTHRLTIPMPRGEQTPGMAISPDGSKIATFHALRARIWDATTGKELVTLFELAKSTNSGGTLVFSPDGKTLAVAEDKDVKLWDAGTGRELATLSGHAEGIRSLAVSADGKVLATGSQGNRGEPKTRTVRLWDLAAAKELITEHAIELSDDAMAMAFSPDGKTLAAGLHEGDIKLFDVATGKERLTWKGHPDWVMSLAYSPDGKILASGCRDGTAKLWESTTGKELANWEAHTKHTHLAFAPNGKVLATAGHHDDKTVKLWDVTEPDTAKIKEIQTMDDHTDTIWAIAFARDGTLATAGDDAVRLWASAKGRKGTD
jgi:RNA polymerase sigma factor (sigma-70 family)